MNTGAMPPPDTHVHSEWSWDAPAGSLELACARAEELRLPAIAFTDHADFTPWTLPPDTGITEDVHATITPERVLLPPALDVSAYHDTLIRCRRKFPGLTILSGIELSEPHWHPEKSRALLEQGDFDVVVAAVHSARTNETDEAFTEVRSAFDEHAATDVMDTYLTEIRQMTQQWDAFDVLAHIDYPLRGWPRTEGRHDPHTLEKEYRETLRCLADAHIALEINTRLPLDPLIIGWWREEGGAMVTFGSDAHTPSRVGSGLAQAATMAKEAGFGPRGHRLGFWSHHQACTPTTPERTTSE